MFTVLFLGNRLKAVPAKLGTAPNLTTLDVSHNNIKVSHQYIAYKIVILMYLEQIRM